MTLINPETVYKWQRKLIKRFWIFPSNKSRVGRPPVPAEIKALILDMKNRNLYWGYKRIQGELLKRYGVESTILCVFHNPTSDARNHPIGHNPKSCQRVRQATDY